MQQRVSVPRPYDRFAYLWLAVGGALSLFSGGGGLDVGFDYAGFVHVASFEILDFAAETINDNRPEWVVFSGSAGDVTSIDWKV